MSPGAKAALAIWGLAIGWDLVCPPKQTISEAIERGLNDKRTEPLVLLAIMTTGLHLLRAVDPKYDIYTLGFKWIGKLMKRTYD